MEAPACRALTEAFDRELTAAGWTRKDTTSSSTRYERGRSQVAIGTVNGAVVSWSVFPTIPPPGLYPGIVFTRPSPAPLVTFTIDDGAGRLHVSRHAVDRSGKLTKEPFIEGDAAQVLFRLIEESDRKVDEFVRTVESQPQS